MGSEEVTVKYIPIIGSPNLGMLIEDAKIIYDIEIQTTCGIGRITRHVPCYITGDPKDVEEFINAKLVVECPVT